MEKTTLALPDLNERWYIEKSKGASNVLIIDLENGVSFDLSKFELVNFYKNLLNLKYSIQAGLLENGLLYPLHVKDTVVIYLSEDDISLLLQNIPLTEDLKKLSTNLVWQEGCALLQ